MRVVFAPDSFKESLGALPFVRATWRLELD